MKQISLAVALLLTQLFAFGNAVPADSPAGAKPIGGKWFVVQQDKPTNYHHDGQQFVDLFSYHFQDSNSDGIDNVRLSHDADFLIRTQSPGRYQEKSYLDRYGMKD